MGCILAPLPRLEGDSVSGTAEAVPFPKPLKNPKNKLWNGFSSYWD
jgi:hypothetical protein